MPDPAFTLVRDADTTGDRRRVRLSGSVVLDDGVALWRELSGLVRGAKELEVDVAGVDRLDGGAAALLTTIAGKLAAAGGSLTWKNARGDTARLLELYDCSHGGPCGRPQPSEPGTFADIGDFVVRLGESIRAILAFIGDLVVGLLRAIQRPRTVHFGEFGSLVERAGTDAIPIVLLINFLVGAILGLQGAIQLHRFGGDQFLANLVGLSVIRELGPLMTAILVTGRSGAAYAAELGTMTVNEEIDALRTLGQDPQRFLVFPRVLALLVVVPVLTVIGDVIGAVGGLAIAVGYLEQPTVVYLQALQRAVHLGDFGTGILKSVAFAFAIGLISCQRGLATRGAAAGVGRSTTSAVVVVVFMLVLLDAIFTWIFSLLDW